MFPYLRLTLKSTAMRTARLARDLWGKVNDIWENEHRVWEDII